MAQEPWNKVHIPFPSAISSCRIAFTESTGVLIECLLADCKKVLTLLRSVILQTEIRVLYELLYVLNNSFRQHKPFRSLKQVEQCINRLKEMKLQTAIEDLKELCPNKSQREVGTEIGECDVPSQPMLEWLCLKLLGASNLLARTLERCTHAFLRTRQHLLLSEFIVLNVVLTSMLSRLWVFFRGILRALIPMYRRTTELLQQVSQSQHMAYLTDFTLPVDLKDFLVLSYPDLLLEDDSTKPPWTSRKKKSQFLYLSKLFKDTDEKEEKEAEMLPVLASGLYSSSNVDLGTSVTLQLRRDVSSCGLNIKALLQKPCKTTKQMFPEPRLKLDFSSQAGVCEKRKFLKLLKKVSSFSNMTAQLKEMIDWCKTCKLHQERKRLSFLYLKCVRMESLEADGIRVEKRLKKFKVKVHKVLLQKFPLRCSSSSAPFRRSKWHHRISIRSYMAHYRTARQRSACARMCSKRVQDFKILVKNRRNCRTVDQKEELSEHNVSTIHEEEKPLLQTVVQKPDSVNKDDIDDIFASIGF